MTLMTERVIYKLSPLEPLLDRMALWSNLEQKKIF